MNDLNQILTQLREVHEPEAVGWWPPAFGWYLLVILIVAIVAAIIYIYRARKNSIRRHALIELQRIERDYQIDHDANRLLKKLSVFVRRVALAKKVEGFAGLTGSQWLQTLDGLSKQAVFVGGPGQTLADGPYKDTIEVDADELIPAIRNWARNLK